VRMAWHANYPALGAGVKWLLVLGVRRRGGGGVVRGCR
jgi:hypothetical protein